jgi:hypothetical protein
MKRCIRLVVASLVVTGGLALAVDDVVKPADKPKAACPACPIATGVDSALRQIPAVEKAVTEGRKDEALKELAAVRALLAQVQKDMAAMAEKMKAGGTCCPECRMPCCAGKTAEPAKGAEGPKGVINDVCPIMGSKIDPAKVPDNLTRMYKGAKVGFCCGGCPARWDSMSDAKKAEFIAKYAGK